VKSLALTPSVASPDPIPAITQATPPSQPRSVKSIDIDVAAQSVSPAPHSPLPSLPPSLGVQASVYQEISNIELSQYELISQLVPESSEMSDTPIGNGNPRGSIKSESDMEPEIQQVDDDLPVSAAEPSQANDYLPSEPSVAYIPSKSSESNTSTFGAVAEEVLVATSKKDNDDELAVEAQGQQENELNTAENRIMQEMQSVLLAVHEDSTIPSTKNNADLDLSAPMNPAATVGREKSFRKSLTFNNNDPDITSPANSFRKEKSFKKQPFPQDPAAIKDRSFKKQGRTPSMPEQGNTAAKARVFMMGGQ
jgi:hypothetical protein